MSPASSGTLEVEKYIGACLISQTRPKTVNINATREVFFSRLPDCYPGSYVNFDGRFRIQRCNAVDRWAGGMPLISFANHQKRNRRIEPDFRSSSPKAEEHNPLARLAVHTQGAPLILSKNFNRRNQKNTKNFDSTKKTTNKCDTQSVGVDTVSVTSDESSGSANSDNCLPRIIKPRKRRKKDRKPSLLNRSLNQDGFSTDSASPDIDSILRPYTPFIFDPTFLVPETLPLTIKPDESETPQLHHSFEDVEELDDVDINGNQTVCQCRYCDPSGQIWDVDRNCYSPFLTTPRFTNVNTFLPKYTANDIEHCLVHGMSSVSLDDEKKNDSKTLPSCSGDLEVSTEIVTFLNGHRDIEIKFFSSSSADNVRALTKGPDRILSGDDGGVNNECNEE